MTSSSLSPGLRPQPLALDLGGRTALVTGAASGIGEEEQQLGHVEHEAHRLEELWERLCRPLQHVE
ncbi:hypothetical protein ACWDZ8_45535, partial [Streptomyces sp. NPDC003233]